MSTAPSATSTATVPIPAELIERRIFAVRSQKVMLDSDLADMYGVPTKVLNQAVRRNLDRFPEDFMFQLTQEEADGLLRSQNVTSNTGRGGRRYRPRAFTEQGVAMLSSVLKSDRAVMVNIAIMRAFVKLREAVATHRDLAGKIEALELKYGQHDQEIEAIFEAIRRLLEPPPDPPKRRIGFHSEN